MSPDSLTAWIGKSEESDDVVTAAPLAGLAATLDHADPPWRPGLVPPLGHWLYFLPRARQAEIAADGHPAKGGFLPPVALPRRMWAGSRLWFPGDLAVGEAARRTSTILDVTRKQGRSGEMVFVTVGHEIRTDRGLAVREEHDIVYREAAAASAPADAAVPAEPADDEGAAPWERPVTPDPVLLFRYSALTFNGHRIHYDRAYCEREEGYPGLVVHGPLMATLLVDLFLRHTPGARVTAFRFRARRPVFDIHPFTVRGRPTETGARLWITRHDGLTAMTADLEAE